MLTTTGYYTGPDAGDIYQEMKARRGTESPACHHHRQEFTR